MSIPDSYFLAISSPWSSLPTAGPCYYEQLQTAACAAVAAVAAVPPPPPSCSTITPYWAQRQQDLICSNIGEGAPAVSCTCPLVTWIVENNI